MNWQTSVKRRVRFGVRVSWREHLLGVDLMFATKDDPERLFTLLVGVPFVAFKLTARTHPLGLRGAT